uniref:Response regulatory domain-containing protein n=1 Tax=Grammatophora oceanica TaxID=210454 RepID=A0A6U5PP61_9STRA|mmetsp:Transcript_5900/g.8381  ORF Transcript_5900/g.8381 Transcript_5900/m.8381 type:complete len:1382 (+) Transcript_5900:112-4257(+)|eukprot:CAMPEP_0194036550 /NCGR_PEP_ID=MMETSP0009_2-20130614/8906_1 /TAXON_ID=210454 /ORGANISM="Grammatophora oceanica, Strain CCMP 410" /LENGTH=1381 /DNA_ID=CAMNT_0038678353 /DNA_START=90 /DNA_END=4235 /DNA_ORIENTATION=-
MEDARLTSEEEALMALLQQEQALAAGQPEVSTAAEQLLHEMMRHQVVDEDAAASQEDVRSLLEMMAQQERMVAMEQQQEPQIPLRPTSHYLTVAQDGTILEATETVTGFPPNALLMTSWFDAVYDEDIPGFLACKQYFWDKGETIVHVYLRRRSLDGDWIWLKTKVIDYIDQPVQGYIVQEDAVAPEEEEYAIEVNRITRIAAILVQAVEAARASPEQQQQQHPMAETTNPPSNNAAAAPMNTGPNVPGGNTEIPLVADDAAAYQAWLRQATQANEAGMAAGRGVASLPNNSNGSTADQFQNNSNHKLSAATDSLQSIMQAASNGGAVEMATEKGNSDPEPRDDAIAALEKELMSQTAEQKKSFDPMSALKAVRAGICLDLGMIRLSHNEVKLVTLVLTGRIQIDQVGVLLFKALNSEGLTAALGAFQTESERNLLFQQSQPPLHSLELPRRRPRPPEFGAPAPIPKGMSPAAISVINLSYTYIGNSGVDLLSEILYVDGSSLRTLDLSFCGIEEKGIISLAKGLTKRKRKNLNPLKGVVLAGNYISYRAAKDLGLALSPSLGRSTNRRHKHMKNQGKTGYDEESESSEDDSDDDDDIFSHIPTTGKRRGSLRRSMVKPAKKKACCDKDHGLQVLHLGATSLTGEALFQLLQGLGPHCPICELSIPSNHIGATGAKVLVEFIEANGNQGHAPMQFLTRLDLTNNHLGNDGTAKLTRAISKRNKVHFVDLRLSSNDIGSAGVETIMNKLLLHNILSLSLDKNNIGDQGCQLVAASLRSMHTLSRLNLSFNQIGSRGVNTLMKTLIACDSITYLGLSGNIMKISGAIAMGFTLAQHPRLEELDLDNCCLSQAAQCHIVAGVISNRWVPMKVLNGFQAGPPMAAIGAIDVFAHTLSNEECFSLRRDEQMKTILQWMESNRTARQNGRSTASVSDSQYLTPEFVSTMNDVHGSPSQNAYLRMLGWLSKIPFDEDELTSLRKYFYDVDGGEGDRGSDGYINLKLRGDLLAALDSGVADEIRDNVPGLEFHYKGSVGMDLAKINKGKLSKWSSLRGSFSDVMPELVVGELAEQKPMAMETVSEEVMADYDDDGNISDVSEGSSTSRKRRMSETNLDAEYSREAALNQSMKAMDGQSSLVALSRQSLHRSSSQGSTRSLSSERKGRMKPRITMFPAFESKLDELKATAKDMMDNEVDPDQQDVILTQYAEASLTILRQLRYHCMNSGLDGWRQGETKRKVLIVDDSLVTRKMVARAFEKANFIVDTAENGVEGVKKLKHQIYDIAFMDIDMPVMNGFEATKALRQWEDSQRPGARQPICALTAAYVDDFERSELMKFKEAGLDVMESKPCNIPRLFKVVDDVSPMFSDLSISVSQGTATPTPTPTPIR